MRIAITGGTGFVGRHLARRLLSRGDAVVLIARGEDRRDASVRSEPNVQMVATSLSDPVMLLDAFHGCDAVVHLAGINRETGSQTYDTVHVDGTRHVVAAAEKAGVRKMVMLSFLRARPDCGSPYHESKWMAEEIIRASALDYTIVKAGMIHGPGDHMLDHLSHTIHTLPLFATVGMIEKPIRPLAIDDLIDILEAALTDPRLQRTTVAVTGPEQLFLSEAARRVARVLNRRLLIVPAPLWFQYFLAMIFEATMRVPLVAMAQVRILSEGVVDAVGMLDSLPEDLSPRRGFTDDEIRRGLPLPARFGLRDLRCFAAPEANRLHT